MFAMADQFRKQATECFKRSLRAADERDRHLWMKLARYWELMADARDVGLECAAEN